MLLPGLLLFLLCCCGEEAADLQEPVPAPPLWSSTEEIHVEVTEDNFCLEVALVTCATARECCSPMIMYSASDYLDSSEEDCLRYRELECAAAFSAALLGMGKGTVTLDVPLAKECLEELLHRGEPCFKEGKAEDLAPSCGKRLFVGKQTEGKTCLDDVECVEGLRCGPDFVCSPPPAAGKPCAIWSPEPCAPALFCSAEGVCVEELKKGEECSAGLGCGQGLFCDVQEEGNPGVCAPLAKLGGTCQADSPCATSLCQPGKCLYAWGWDEEGFSENDCKQGVCAFSGKECGHVEYGNVWAPCTGTCGDGLPCTEDSECKEGAGPCLQEECVVACAGGRVCAERRNMMSYCSAAMQFGAYPEEDAWDEWW